MAKKYKKKGTANANKRGAGSSRGEARSIKKIVEVTIRDTLPKMGQQFNDLRTLVTDQYIESMKSLKLKHIHEKKVELRKESPNRDHHLDGRGDAERRSKSDISKKNSKKLTNLSYKYTTVNYVFKIYIDKTYRNYYQSVGEKVLPTQEAFEHYSVVDHYEKSLINTIRGFSLSDGMPWHLLDEVYIPINYDSEFH
ncbi:hypothetical protein BC332_13430 [Capsicum chinense]|nr:hypothetical protein BC332_13430 [Capsicum chinense]